MGFWSWLRSIWPWRSHAFAESNGDGEGDVDATAESDAATEPDAADDRPLDASHRARHDRAGAQILAGTIDDYNTQAQIGLITLLDGAVLGFGVEACEGFTPLIGLRVAIHGTGVPPESALNDPSDLPGLWASRLVLWPGSESEYAARLRIHQVERALRGAGERGESAPGEPPWARGKNRPGRKPSGPNRPADAFFVLTLVLDRELAKDAAALAALIDPPTAPAAADEPAIATVDPPPATVWRRPSVRIIPLVRNQQTEPGFSAEVQSGSHRAFLLYRPQPYGDSPENGRTHVGLFVGGPHSPRVAARLSERNDQAPVAVTQDAARILADLARAVLLADPQAPGVVLNRAGRAFKPRDIALAQLGESPAAHVPFVFWLDWNRGERNGHPCMLSSGMEMLALPDLAVSLPNSRSPQGSDPDDAAEARARDVLLYVCDALVKGTLREVPDTLFVPRHIRMLPGSQLDVSVPDEGETYAVTEHTSEWITLTQAASSA